jgi:DNA helicase-2/ATP-dependent DNA helicase PcrA
MDEAASSQRPTAPPRPHEASAAPGGRYNERDLDADGAGADMALRRGSKVRHERFGVGVVASVDPGEEPIVTVNFPGWGLKRIKAAFLRPLDQA